ncbi:hypothetical protein [Clostridium culturomicium]|uniref:hypothetical protein n=1 Tax=Clostridium culturomicium TaxID=1499683 RepID=UPI0038576A04
MNFEKKLNKKLDDIQNKLEKFRSKIKFKKSYKYILLTVFIATGYIFFLSSGVIFESNSRVASTELNKVIELKQSSVFIKNTEYNKKQNLLEIKLGIKMKQVNFANDYEFEAIAKENTNEKLDVEFIKVDGENIVLFVNTPKKWSAIAVDIKENYRNEGGETRIYIDEDKCIKNNELEKRTEEEYMIENIEEEIKIINETIKKYEEEKEEKNKTIENTNAQIDILEEKKEYLTEKETLEANQKIEAYKSNIKSIETSIIEIEGKVREEKEKDRMANKKMNDIIKNLPKDIYKKYR